MLWAVILFPALAGVLAAVWPWRSGRRSLLLVGSIGHLAGVLGLWAGDHSGGQWLGADAAGMLFLTIASVLFLAVAVYTYGYLGKESSAAIVDSEEGFLFRNEPEAVFISCLLLFLAAMTLVCVSQHLGLLWVSVEATTLVSAPLIHFHRHHRSLEATWKYLLICSVGIALALLGNFFLAYAARGHVSHLNLDALLSHAGELDPTWLKAAFILFLVGYGTKMGLAPMHTWLPDAHSEAPSMVSALLSGALLNCAFLALLRGHSVLAAAGLGPFSGELLILFGLISMGLAGAFLIRQTDIKRMLAYSSVEHMGVLALGAGLGGIAGLGSMLHAISHSLTKGMLFLLAGNILAAYGTKNISEIRGVIGRCPATGRLWMAGFLAIVGSPPFGLFVSELLVLKGALVNGRWGIAIVFLVALGVIFTVLARMFLAMVFAHTSPDSDSASTEHPALRERIWAVAPPAVLGILVLFLGFFVPPSIWHILQAAALRSGIQ